MDNPDSGGYSGLVLQTLGHDWSWDAVRPRVPAVEAVRLRLGSNRFYLPQEGDLEIDRPEADYDTQAMSATADKIFHWIKSKCPADTDQEKLRTEAEFLAGIVAGPLPPARHYPDGPFDRRFRGVVWGGGITFETLATRNLRWLLVLPVGLICFGLMLVIVRRVCDRIPDLKIRATSEPAGST